MDIIYILLIHFILIMKWIMMEIKIFIGLGITNKSPLVAKSYQRGLLSGLAESPYMT